MRNLSNQRSVTSCVIRKCFVEDTGAYSSYEYLFCTSIVLLLLLFVVGVRINVVREQTTHAMSFVTNAYSVDTNVWSYVTPTDVPLVPTQVSCYDSFSNTRVILCRPKKGVENFLPLRMMVYSKLLPRSVYQITQIMTVIGKFPLSKILFHRVEIGTKIITSLLY